MECKFIALFVSSKTMTLHERDVLDENWKFHGDVITQPDHHIVWVENQKHPQKYVNAMNKIHRYTVMFCLHHGHRIHRLVVAHTKMQQR
jgi:hypothetical protein